MVNPEILSSHQPVPDRVPSVERERKAHLLQYLAGYFDASGSVTIARGLGRNRQECFYPRLDIARINPTVVDLMHEVFPAYHGQRTIPTGKTIIRWYAQSQKAMEVLNTLFPYLRIKKEQTLLAQGFARFPRCHSTDESHAVKERMMELNKMKCTPTPGEQFETPYLAGLFDAHGYIALWKSPEGYDGLQIGIALKNPPFIASLRQQLDAQKRRSDSEIHFSAHRAMAFLLRILPFLRVYKRLAELAIAFQNVAAPPFTKKNYQERKALRDPIEKEFWREFDSLPKKRRKKIGC